MSTVLIVIGCFTLLGIGLIGWACFFIKPDHDLSHEEQFNRDEISKVTVDKDGIALGDIRP